MVGPPRPDAALSIVVGWNLPGRVPVLRDSTRRRSRTESPPYPGATAQRRVTERAVVPDAERNGAAHASAALARRSLIVRPSRRPGANRTCAAIPREHPADHPSESHATSRRASTHTPAPRRVTTPSPASIHRAEPLKKPQAKARWKARLRPSVEPGFVPLFSRAIAEVLRNSSNGSAR